MSEPEPAEVKEAVREAVREVVRVENADEFADAIKNMTDDEKSVFYERFGRMAMRVFNEHLMHLGLRQDAAAKAIKTAKGLKRRRAKEMLFSARIFRDRLMERFIGTTIAAYTDATGREIQFGTPTMGDPENVPETTTSGD